MIPLGMLSTESTEASGTYNTISSHHKKKLATFGERFRQTDGGCLSIVFFSQENWSVGSFLNKNESETLRVWDVIWNDKTSETLRVLVDTPQKSNIDTNNRELPFPTHHFGAQKRR